MEKFVTYLLGAGASQRAVPTVNKMCEEMKKYFEIFKDDKFLLSENETFKDISSSKTKREFQNDFIIDLQWLYEIGSAHVSIDTFAKKLFLRGNDEDKALLNKLKITLSIYLILEQARNKVDQRYDSFWASILKDNTDGFPSKTRIISWNYDYQLEKTYGELISKKNLTNIQNVLKISSKHFHKRPLDETKFGVYKLNGTTGFSGNKNENFHFNDNILDSFDRLFVENIIKNYAWQFEQGRVFYPTLSFAWEDDFDDKNH